MRVRYEIYTGGLGAGCIAKCDLSVTEARRLFNELKKNAKCGWAELVAEDDDEGGYMKVVDTFDHVHPARIVTTLSH